MSVKTSDSTSAPEHGTVRVTSNGTIEWYPTTSLEGVPLTAYAGSHSYSGSLNVKPEYLTVTAGGLSGTERLRSALSDLVQAVQAGAACRCAPTEVCPDCHALNRCLAAAESVLQPVYRAYDPKLHGTIDASGTFNLDGATHVDHATNLTYLGTK